MVPAILAPAALASTITINNFSMKAVFTTYVILAVIGGVAFVLSLLFRISPCPVYHIAGFPCPACGLTRAFLSLVQFDLRGAFAYHPLFILVPLLPFLMWTRIPQKRRDVVAFSILGVFILVWVVRMVLLYPHTSPMTYNENSLFERLFHSTN